MNTVDYLPANDSGLPAAVGEHDPAFEDDCLHLAARLEHRLAQLEEAKKQGKTAALLGRAKEMMVELLDFAEAKFDESSLAEPLERTREVYQAIKQYEQQTSSHRGIGRLFGVDHASKNEFQDESYLQVGEDLSSLLAQFFELFAGRLADETAATRWRNCASTLLGELKRKW